MHLSRGTYRGTAKGPLGFMFPSILHLTYCRQTVTPNEVGEEPEVDCDECIQSVSWEEIDMATETMGG